MLNYKQLLQKLHKSCTQNLLDQYNKCPQNWIQYKNIVNGDVQSAYKKILSDVPGYTSFVSAPDSTVAINNIRTLIDNGYVVGISFFTIGYCDDCTTCTLNNCGWWNDNSDTSVRGDITSQELQVFKQLCGHNNQTCPAHAVVVSAYDDLAGTIEIKNSWGNLWKDGGYAKLSYNYVTAYSRDNGGVVGYTNRTTNLVLLPCSIFALC